MKILLVNDDGVGSHGLMLLADELRKDHDVTIVAPDGQRSAASHSLTLRDSLPVEDLSRDGMRIFAVGGTPADCVRIALDVFCKDAELVISGPNIGWNVAFDTLYSGTVGAALEGAMHRVPSIALSGYHKDTTEEDVVRAFMRIFPQLDIKRDISHMLNINIPPLPLEKIKGVKWVKQGCYHQWDDHYWAGAPETERGSYQVRGAEVTAPDVIEDDSGAVLNGYIALTPLTFDMTDHSAIRDKEIKL